MSKKIRTEAVDYLFDAILSLKDKEECYTFFEDICTINELLSLSQRFEVAKMLREQKTYLPPAVDEREYFVKADMSKFLALIIDSLNHDLTIGAVMNPTDKIHKLLQKYHQV